MSATRHAVVYLTDFVDGAYIASTVELIVLNQTILECLNNDLNNRTVNLDPVAGIFFMQLCRDAC